MTREEHEAQLNRMVETLQDWRTARGRYVPVGNPDEGDIVMVENCPICGRAERDTCRCEDEPEGEKNDKHS